MKNFFDWVSSGYVPARFNNGNGVTFDTEIPIGKGVVCIQNGHRFFRTFEEIAFLFYRCEEKMMNPFISFLCKSNGE